jgi:two-component system response regulator FixJ
MSRASERFSVYIVEDDASVLDSICALLNAHGYETVPCTSAEEFLERYAPEKKACIMLDLRLPGMSGMQLQRHLGDIGVSLPIIVVTAHGDVPLAVQAMRAGAVDFIEKPAQAGQLLEALRIAGDLLYNRAAPHVPKAVVADRLTKLTEREREVLQHILQGKLSKEIAGELGVSQRTIEVHRSRIREKMQARGIADLVRMLG